MQSMWSRCFAGADALPHLVTGKGLLFARNSANLSFKMEFFQATYAGLKT